MEDAPSRQRGPPPPASAGNDERSSRYSPPPSRQQQQQQQQNWQRDGDRSDRLPLRARAPLDDDRYYPRGLSTNGAGPSSSMNGGPGPSSSTSIPAGGRDDKRVDDMDRDRSWRGAGAYSRDDRSTPFRAVERPYSRSAGLSGPVSPQHGGVSSAAGPPPASVQANGQGSSSSSYRRPHPHQRTRSQSPPGPSSSSTYHHPAAGPASQPSARQRFEHSPAKRPWGGPRDNRDSLPPSSSYDRDGPYRGTTASRGAPYSDRRPNGVVGPPPSSASYSNDRFPRQERDSRSSSRIEDHHPADSRRPFDNGWSRHSKPNGDANGWRDDKGKGPAYDIDERRPSFSRNNQNNPPHPSTNGDRARSPDSLRSRGRRSPSIDEFPLRSPASSTHSQSRLSDRLAVDYDRPPPRTFPQPRLSAPPGQSHPPLNRANSAGGQPAGPRQRDFEFPRDRPPDDALLENRLSRSTSVTQGNTPSKLGNKGWPPRRRSLSPSPTREAVPTTVKSQSSPRSLAERLGPLASAANEFQDRIEPVVFRSRTPPPRSPVRQSAPSTLQQHDRLPQSAPRPPVARSFTPPLPSPAKRSAAMHRPNDIVQQETKDASPSPKLASSPSDAAQSSPRPSTTDLDQATSEITQARTSPDISKEEDESMLDVDSQEQEEGEVEDDVPSSKASQATPVEPQQRTMDKMPRAPIPLPSGITTPSEQLVIEPEKVATPQDGANNAILEAAAEKVKDNDALVEDQAATQTETVEVVTKVEILEVEMEDVPAVPAEPVQTEQTEPDMQLADVSNASMIVKDDQMDIDQEQEKSVLAEQENNQQQTQIGSDEIGEDFEETEAEEEDLEAKEFEKSLISFIEVNEPDDDDTSVDLSNILEDNKLRAPISLPLAVHMPEADQDVLEVKPFLLENHDLLDGWLQDSMAARDKRRGEKIFRLRQQYKELDAEWQAHCNKLEKIRDRQKRRQNIPIMPPTPQVDATGISIVPTTPNLLAPSGRSNRRSAASSIGYGDAVRSEAEFLEILASLEDADMRDPNLRAMRTTATMPDQIIDESEYTLQQYEDNNGLVTNPFEHYNINKTPDSWTEEEIAIFCRRYALYPKQFGKIAAAIPDKSTNQCVLFYYRSKKKIDFRALVDRRNRDGRRKRSRADKSSTGGNKGPSLLGNIERARGGEADEDEDDEPQTPGAAIAQESTVLSTAKALTQQINGTSDLPSRPENGKRLLTGRSASGKKAIRFLSPSDEQSVNSTDDGVPPPSDGAMAAAEALGFLATVPSGDPNDPTSRPSSAKQKKRKPSMSESALNVSFDDDGTPRAVNAAKRSRPHSSSYWSVADKNEFIRLLMIHGKDYNAISEGIKSKTAVQCKNFFQNNVKKMNLADIAAKAEGEFGNTSGDFGIDSPMGRPDMPSVFGEPDSSMPQEPTSGYFIPSHHSKNRDSEEHKPSARSGGMNLRNMLDDAPDAEGGAHPHLSHESRTHGDDDSATEDEAEPARYAQESVDARGALRQAHAERTASQQRHASRIVKEEMISVDSALYRSTAAEHGHYQPHMRSSSFGSRQEFPAEREQYSPSFHTAHHSAREYSLPPRHAYGSHLNGHYEPGQPHSAHWIPPYEGRSIYGPPASASYYPRGRQEEQPPVGYYRREHPAYLDSPVYDKSVHRTAFPPRSLHQPPHYSGSGRSPPHQPGPPIRHQSDPSSSHPESPYYDHHYSVSRAP